MNNGVLQSKNWATRIRQKINLSFVEQRRRDPQVLHPPPINKTRAATPQGTRFLERGSTADRAQRATSPVRSWATVWVENELRTFQSSRKSQCYPPVPARAWRAGSQHREQQARCSIRGLAQQPPAARSWSRAAAGSWHKPLHCLTGFPSVFSGFPSILTCFLSILSCFLSTLSHKSHRLHSDSRHCTSFPAPASFIRAQAARKRCRRGCRSWEEKMADCKAFAVQSAFVSKFQFKSRSWAVLPCPPWPGRSQSCRCVQHNKHLGDFTQN